MFSNSICFNNAVKQTQNGLQKKKKKEQGLLVDSRNENYRRVAAQHFKRDNVESTRLSTGNTFEVMLSAQKHEGSQVGSTINTSRKEREREKNAAGLYWLFYCFDKTKSDAS